MKGPPQPTPRFRTLPEALAVAGESASGFTFVDLQEHERALSFRELRESAGRVAGALGALGVAPGDRVACILPTSPGFASAFFGVLEAGAVPVPLYPPFRLGQLAEYHASTARMCAAVQARVVITDRLVRNVLGALIEQARPPLGCRVVEDLLRHEGSAPGVPVPPDALALIQFSSGATADPKPVALSHADVMAQLAALEAVLPEEERFPQLGVSWLPLYHDMGLIGCLLLAVYVPGPLVLIPPECFLTRPALWLRAVSRHRATVSAAPSFAYAHCAARVRDEDLGGVDLSSWRMALCGAEPISLEALQGFAKRFAPFGFSSGALRSAYGLAEATLAVTIAPASCGLRAVELGPGQQVKNGHAGPGTRGLVSVGSPLPGFEVEVRLPSGKQAREREVGRVFVRGPSVMTGYLGQPEATAAVLAEGWLDTGDLGFLDSGELVLCGREKDLIIIRGANHGPEEFEVAALSLEPDGPGCVVALGLVPPGEEAEQLVLLVERGSDKSAEVADEKLISDIDQAVLERTGIRPYTVILLEPGTLPRTSSGKLRRGEARRRFLSGELRPPAHPGALRLSLEVVRSVLAFARVRLAGEN